VDLIKAQPPDRLKPVVEIFLVLSAGVVPVVYQLPGFRVP